MTLSQQLTEIIERRNRLQANPRLSSHTQMLDELGAFLEQNADQLMGILRQHEEGKLEPSSASIA